MHALERLQQRAMELEEELIAKFSNRKLGKSMVSSAKEVVDYSYQTEKNMEWYVKYIAELERRI